MGACPGAPREVGAGQRTGRSELCSPTRSPDLHPPRKLVGLAGLRPIPLTLLFQPHPAPSLSTGGFPHIYFLNPPPSNAICWLIPSQAS